MTGAFGIDPALVHLSSVQGDSDGEYAYIRYGVGPSLPFEAGYVEIVFSTVEGEGFGLNIHRDAWVATYLGEGCTWEVEVTPTTVSGHIKCTDLPAENEADGSTGTVDVELDFTAEP